MAQQIQLRRGLAATWTAKNPILAIGEIGIEKDTDKFKIGNGVDTWNVRPYGGIIGPAGPAGVSTGSVGAGFDGLSSVLATGKTIYVPMTYAGTLTSWQIECYPSGSLVIDVWKTNYAGAPPTVANTITGANKPTVTSALKAQGNVSGWTTTFAAGDVIAFYIESASTVTNATIMLGLTKS